MSKKPAKNSEAAYELMVAEEELILEAQMVIQRVLNERNMPQKVLATKLGVSESYISQMLGDSARNLTLRTIARVLKVLNAKASIMLDDCTAGGIETLDVDSCDTLADNFDVAAMASKVALKSLSNAWGGLTSVSTSSGVGSRKRGDAQAFGAFDPPVEEMAIAA